MANKQLRFIPELPFNFEAILSSLDVISMTIEERVMYFMLLFASGANKQRQCYLKIDDDSICSLCGISPAQLAKHKDKVFKKFKVTDDGYIYNERMVEAYNKELKRLKKEKPQQLSNIAAMINYPFDEFWEDYDKKVGSKSRLIPKWLKLTDHEREYIRQDIPKRKEAQPNKQFRPHPESYLNGRLWENEIIDYKKKDTTQTTISYDKQNTKI